MNYAATNADANTATTKHWQLAILARQMIAHHTKMINNTVLRPKDKDWPTVVTKVKALMYEHRRDGLTDKQFFYLVCNSYQNVYLKYIPQLIKDAATEGLSCDAHTVSSTN